MEAAAHPELVGARRRLEDDGGDETETKKKVQSGGRRRERRTCHGETRAPKFCFGEEDPAGVEADLAAR